jgi:hypothetical protein
VLSEDELRAAYADSIIDTFQLQDVSWLTLDVDNQYVNVKYTNGASTTLLLGSIYYGAPVRTEQYGQSSGIIYPTWCSTRRTSPTSSTVRIEF